MSERPSETTPAPAPEATSGRLASIDVYRGFVMFLLMAEALEFAKVAAAKPGNGFWAFLASQQQHAEWVGCSLHDMIQPSFSFLVGVAVPFSIASRLRRGQAVSRLTLHALWRALLLILLGVFLRSAWAKQTYWTFEDTVTQIGLGYPILFLLGLRSVRTQAIGFAVIVIGYWAAWALYPVAPAGFDYAAVGVPPDWPHLAQGFAAHWNKNANLGAAFDQWFLNLFPREKPFVFNGGGYLTLSFIPTLGTMVLGLIAGEWLRRDTSSPAQKVKPLLLAGVAGLVLGGLVHVSGVCPIVKRIWTPSWTLFSGGWCFLLLAGFYWVIDGQGWKRWAFPLQVIGMNSIAAYVLTWAHNPVENQLEIHLGHRPFELLGPAFVPTLHGLATILVFWGILYWMYRRKIFLKV